MKFRTFLTILPSTSIYRKLAARKKASEQFRTSRKMFADPYANQWAGIPKREWPEQWPERRMDQQAWPGGPSRQLTADLSLQEYQAFWKKERDLFHSQVKHKAETEFHKKHRSPKKSLPQYPG